MRLGFYSFFFLAIFSLHKGIAVVFRFSNLACKSYNETRLVFNVCRLKAVNRDRVDMNVNGTILSSVNDVKLHIRFFKTENGFKPWLFDFKIDGCRYMRKKYLAVAKFWFNFVMDFSNLNHTCPYVGHVFAKGLFLRPELLGLPIPTGEYMVAERWYTFGMLQADTNITFVYVEDIKVGK